MGCWLFGRSQHSTVKCVCECMCIDMSSYIIISRVRSDDYYYKHGAYVLGCIVAATLSGRKT